MARKRPLLATEVEAGDYDSVSTEWANNSVVIHDGRVHRDGRTLYMSHSRFCLDRVFCETASNDEVYAEAARPLLRNAKAGRRATLLLFGQTGTGKTHTAQGILDGIAGELFLEGGGSVPWVLLQCFELAGSRGGREAFFDLLTSPDSSDRKQV